MIIIKIISIHFIKQKFIMIKFILFQKYLQNVCQKKKKITKFIYLFIILEIQ